MDFSCLQIRIIYAVIDIDWQPIVWNVAKFKRFHGVLKIQNLKLFCLSHLQIGNNYHPFQKIIGFYYKLNFHNNFFWLSLIRAKLKVKSRDSVTLRIALRLCCKSLSEFYRRIKEKYCLLFKFVASMFNLWDQSLRISSAIKYNPPRLSSLISH